LTLSGPSAGDSVNRRSFFDGMVAQALGPSAVISSDPLWAAIDRHNGAYAVLDQALGRQEELETQWLTRSADRDEAELVATRNGSSSSSNWTRSTKRRRGPRPNWPRPSPRPRPERSPWPGTSHLLGTGYRWPADVFGSGGLVTYPRSAFGLIFLRETRFTARHQYRDGFGYRFALADQ
jgi:hypothetical protein